MTSAIIRISLQVLLFLSLWRKRNRDKPKSNRKEYARFFVSQSMMSFVSVFVSRFAPLRTAAFMDLLLV